MNKILTVCLLAIVCSLIPFSLSAQSSQGICESISIQTEGNTLYIRGLDKINTKLRVYDENFDLVSSCEFNCASSIGIAQVTNGETYRLTIEYFSENFGYLLQENIDYIIGAPALEIGVCKGDVTLANQSEVDAFCGCEIITGLFDIGDRFDGANDINDLSNLSGVKVVSDLRVTGTNLTSLSALVNMKVERGLGIYENPLLASLDAFNKMEVIQDVGISNNPVLKQLNAFQQLKEAQLVLSINSNSQLERLNGLGNLEIARGFAFQNNDAFQALDEMVAFKETGRFFSIRLNDQLKSISFADLTGNVDDVVISDNPLLENLPSIGSVTVEQRLQVTNNPKLSNCCELSTLIDDDLTNGNNAGDLLLRDNGGLCNSTTEILENCNGSAPMNCDNITIESNGNQLIVSGINAPIAIVKVFDDNWQLAFECNANCEETIILENLTEGDIYHTDIQFYDSNWQFICVDKQDIEIIGEGNPCGTICQGNVTLSTQAEVDAFCGCEVIAGNLYIGTEGIPQGSLNELTTLAPLSGLKRVEGEFLVVETQLTDYTGLESLENIGGTFSTVLNPDLTSFKGIENLKEIGDALVITINNGLIDIDNFDQLTKIGTQLTIDSNPNLLSIKGFQNLVSVSDETNPIILSVIGFVSNANLKTIAGFDNLKKAIMLDITSNFALESIDGFSQLAEIDIFKVVGNPMLPKLGLGTNLKIVNENLQIKQNNLLNDCCVLSHLVDDNLMNGRVFGTIEINNNNANCTSQEIIVENCNENPIGCENIQISSENNQLTISEITTSNAIVKVFDNNWQLVFECNTNCEETITLENLTAGDIYHTDIQFYDANWQFICEDRQDVEILGGSSSCGNICEGNINLTSQAEVDAFCDCEIINGNLVIGISPTVGSDITNLAKLSKLKTIEGSLSIVNTQLIDFKDLSSLGQIGGNLDVVYNALLNSFQGLNGIQEIPGSLTVLDNPELLDFDSLTDLVNVGDAVTLSINRKLKSLKGLAKLTKVQSLFLLGLSSLESLEGIENIDSIVSSDPSSARGFSLSGCPLITDLSLLQNLKYIQGNVNIVENATLSDCCSISHLIDDNLDNGDITGTVTFDLNPAACNSVAAILENCSDTSPFDCENINVAYENNELIISGLTAPIEIVKVFDRDWNQLFDCFADCDETINIPNVESSIFRIQIATYDEDWNFICHGDQDFIPAGSRNKDFTAVDFTLSPNPAQSEVLIDLKPLAGEKVTLQLQNQFGQVVLTKSIEEVTNLQERMDLSQTPNGLYFLQIQAKGRRAIGKKLLVNKLY